MSSPNQHPNKKTAKATSLDKEPINNSDDHLHYRPDGSPYSQRFNDIYFDTQSGYQQSKEIFIDGNNITERLLQASDTVTIAETGFGTGLNFILTLQAYERAQKSTEKKLPPLHFISVEKYPLSKAQLVKSLAILPQLANYSDLLIALYPQGDPDNFPNNLSIALPESFLDNNIKLTLLFDDATAALTAFEPHINHSRGKQKGLIDIWYLDGFSPAKNPDMWGSELFNQIARLSKAQASLTTFTVAGFVKRELQRIGYRTEKLILNGKKADAQRAIFQQNPITRKGYQLRPTITKPQHVSIIGGGIASACLSYALTKQGVKVTLYCKDMSVAQGASSNAIGALYPLFHQQSDDISLFYQHAFLHAKNLYQDLLKQGFHFAHDWCGLLEVSYKDSLVKRQQAFEEIHAWPASLIHGVNAHQASEHAGIKLNHGGLFMPHAGWISPPELVKQLFNAAEKTNRLRIKCQTKINKLVQNSHNKSWRLISDKENFDASVVVLCGGAENINIEQLRSLPLSATRGQVTSMKTNSVIGPLKTVICHKGYLTPAHNNQHCIGATFQKNNTSATPTSEDDQYNITMLKKCLPELTQAINWQSEDISMSKARLRCMSQDHLPLVGAMPNISEHITQYPHLAKDKNWPYQAPAPCIDNLYLMTGFGARGLCSAPLTAEILTADICNTPFPVNTEMLFNLSPNRFIIRDMIKRKI
ncbi:bifunctional tRNA (5-methylaminomethyl-2-thiouridine)(34)-methyltransferase MnmD/FAD-dependent 5-carboxymethylaminomethyl-2-thiouridine(34) oxidoreductase MnmC [Colwellia sp. D2M02]|uniref:bifunctional tRNA (5-methylaminomethyl-2-thiouridine)(34)-methyltransferase MnmD/FAD-dependent 5-carboxymethylaminomethyl-2-thiouridine(34) oxidoreductase MnmC n=1 Tax=Colwellia sp. D2M02 TaxID=2841562 RepID=UPI001C093E95|nr:bifunctional tRNA (5-methylaminomethyl-2-thiouridine)(34)-methyltransferase MnmD/FAD-dependent 5-carboxymethylaminomethyl-2-thiouridine(34) oxidoreductase MnmC [Colwellia sp. D2M02]MBU2892374.1 bifunctional tRNA (5-methylaminomethyl-2-thiouridine)(34)-methyltransferase MnmD/FAD-dependent 5-carboxymethylaminomethyl-2-thiouridine(34) oxidoreductase MnmC [Colwellia sp. D2M02]